MKCIEDDIFPKDMPRSSRQNILEEYADTYMLQLAETDDGSYVMDMSADSKEALIDRLKICAEALDIGWDNEVVMTTGKINDIVCGFTHVEYTSDKYYGQGDTFDLIEKLRQGYDDGVLIFVPHLNRKHIGLDD
jgi:hypothetical protein